MARTQHKRIDLSEGLLHFTRDRKEENETVPAFDVLKEILQSGVIKAGFGYVKGPNKVVCFTEAPLSAVPGFAGPDGSEYRYRYFGIAVRKKAVFEAGGRPVIYLPDNEGWWIPTEERWRHVRFELGSVDFTHEREWRVRGDFDLTRVPGLYVLVWSADEAREIINLKCPVQQKIRSVLPMQHLASLL